MAQAAKTVFISYRRGVSDFVARAIYQDLKSHGFDVFIDVESIDSGTFDNVILDQIASRSHFILVLTPGSVDRCGEPTDWLRREVTHALERKRNIVPVLADGFRFEDAAPHLEGVLSELPRYNSLTIPQGYFEDAMNKLRARFLRRPGEEVARLQPAAERPPPASGPEAPGEPRRVGESVRRATPSKRRIAWTAACLVAAHVLVVGLVLLLSPRPPSVRWQRTFGGSIAVEGRSVQQTWDGGYIVSGDATFGDSRHVGVYLLKTDARGDSLWAVTYGGSPLGGDYSVQQTADGGYIIAGHVWDYANHDRAYLLRADARGDSLWARAYGTSAGTRVLSAQQASDGGYIAAGYTQEPRAEDVYLVKTDGNGQLVWDRMLGGPGLERGYSVQQTTDGGYIIAGQATRPDGEDVYLAKIDENGGLTWDATFGGPGDQYGYSVRQTSDSGYIIAGRTGSAAEGRSDVLLLKTSASGDSMWARTFGGRAHDEGRSVRQTRDGGYIIAGWTGSSRGGGLDVLLVKTAASGDSMWARAYGGSADDRGYAVQQARGGGYIVAGSTYSDGGVARVYLIKTDADGTAR